MVRGRQTIDNRFRFWRQPRQIFEMPEFNPYLEDAVGFVLQFLTCREEYVVRHRFGLGRIQPETLREIGVELGLTSERIRQIEAKAMRKLRHPFFGALLVAWADLPPNASRYYRNCLRTVANMGRPSNRTAEPRRHG